MGRFIPADFEIGDKVVFRLKFGKQGYTGSFYTSEIMTVTAIDARNGQCVKTDIVTQWHNKDWFRKVKI